MALIGRTAKVLVVEDDESVRRTLVVALSMANFRVVEASTGVAALAVLERNEPDAVVVDLRLPDRQGGAVLQRLRSQSGLAWVAISALDRQEAEKEYGPLGSNFLTKPFDPWDLIRKLGELLQR